MGSQIKTWNVWSGNISPKDEFIKKEIVYSSESIADCYAWIKATKQDMIIIQS